MHATVVVAHPNPAALGHSLARAAVAGLRAGGNEVALLDLAALGFRATMSAEEREAYHGAQPILDPLVAEHAELIRRTDTLVLVYPTWWGGPPAILKGWLERVMVPGVGFRFDEAGRVRPGLTNVRHIVGVSTYGSPRAYVALMTDAGRRIVTRSLRVACGRGTRTTWLGLYSVDRSSPADRHEFIERVECSLAEAT